MTCFRACSTRASMPSLGELGRTRSWVSGDDLGRSTLGSPKGVGFIAFITYFGAFAASIWCNYDH